MQIQLNAEFKDLKGQPVKDSNMAIFLSNLLANSSQPKNAQKFYALAQKFVLPDPVDLDNADFELVRKFVDEAQIPVWAGGQLLEALAEARLQKKAA